MDFAYRYTPEQDAFRERVSSWLDSRARRADGDLRRLSRDMGRMGWLAPSESDDLSADDTVVLLEELNRRGLLRLVAGESQALRTALARWGSGDGHSALARSLSEGALTAWRHLISVSPRGELDADSVGVTATPDADGYLLNGAARFAGVGAAPDLLWLVALVDDAPICLMADARAEGVSISDARALSADAPRAVEFDGVWVLRSDALGVVGDGHIALSAAVSLDARADLPSWVERETGALLAYANAAEADGAPLAADPIRARILAEAYIASRVSRLLRMRAASLESGADEATLAESLAETWRKASATALADSARQVVGPRALLSAADPNAADGGRFERLSRRELAEREAGDAEREAIAAALGLGSQDERD